MAKTTPEQNKALVLEAFETLFNKRDYAGAERFWSDTYIQHSAHIAPGRAGLFDLVRSLPQTLRYENQLILAEGDYVIAHGRFSNIGRPAAGIAADIVRIEDGKLAEHWDVLQDEATQAESVSGLPMFGERFPSWPARGPKRVYSAASFAANASAAFCAVAPRPLKSCCSKVFRASIETS
jgi:predicted SnoaL-like aldol condensation-catalyzing enzyme